MINFFLLGMLAGAGLILGVITLAQWKNARDYGMDLDTYRWIRSIGGDPRKCRKLSEEEVFPDGTPYTNPEGN